MTCLFLLVATLAAYWPVLDCTFVDFDDPLYVSENAILQQGLNLNTIRWAFTSNHAYNWHPVTWLSLMLDFELYRLKPMGYHVTNLLLHMANTILVFWFLARVTRQIWPCALVAALFALHPLHVESVAWVSERKDVLSMFFMMLTLLAYARYAKRPQVVSYLLTLALYVIGLMAKPMLVSLPLLLLLLDYWPLQRILPMADNAGGCKRTDWRVLALEKLPFALLAAIVCVITFVVQHSTGAVGSFTQYPFGIRVANAILAYYYYLVNMAWPAHLACLYPYKLNVLLWSVALAGACLLIISALVLRQWRRAPYMVTGWLWYLVTLLPVIGLVQVGNQAMADRYTYIPLVGVFIMIAWGLPDLAGQLLQKMSGRRLALNVLAIIACGIVVFFGIMTWFQAGTWKDTISVFEHAIAVTENNFLAHNNLANVLPGSGRREDAIYHYTEALRIKPDYAEAHNNIGVALARQGRVDEAVAHYQEALRLRPDCAETYVNLGVLMHGSQSLDEAASLFVQALGINPFLANAHYNLAIVLMQKRMFPDAVNHYVAALEIRPDMPDAYNKLIVSLVACGEYGKAMIAFRAAINLYREWSPMLTHNLWVLATRRELGVTDRADLIRLAEQVGHPENSQDPAFLDSLGVAYAGAGRFQEAIAVASQAQFLMGAENQSQMGALVAERLALYEKNAPYFE